MQMIDRMELPSCLITVSPIPSDLVCIVKYDSEYKQDYMRSRFGLIIYKIAVCCLDK